MSLSDVLPNVQTLSRHDKVRLIQYLASELGQDEASLIEPERAYPVWSPDTAFDAASKLIKALDDERRPS